MVLTGLNRFKPGKIEFIPASGINALSFSRFKPWFKPGGLNRFKSVANSGNNGKGSVMLMSKIDAI